MRLLRWQRWRLRLTSERGLMGWAALEASVPMLPVELVLVRLTQSRPAAAIYLAMLATVFSGIGAIYGYALGFLAESYLPWDKMYTTGTWLERLIHGIDHWGEGLVLLAAFVPVPLGVFSLGAGLLHIGLLPFIFTVVLGRALRFYLVTLLTAHFISGKPNVNSES
ncbi:YqaA family protein [Granulosicoccus antarcticus]|uniref:YqaA family protein n=1 Tax=Granulosicoccus antarcticus TaxID=437505 RepID=UPI0012FE0798|nr:hypothetical protein [Granulosicoccus antarcticus]